MLGAVANWVVPGLIATSPRPGYVPGPEFNVPLEKVHEWVERAQGLGIASIMCLLHNDQLPLYSRSLPGGLIEFYRSQGFFVAHIPTYDGLTVPFTPEQYEEAWELFRELPKPVLVHCSAGMDRTGRIVRYLLDRLREAPEFGLVRP